MKARKINNNYVIKLEKGEEILKTVTTLQRALDPEFQLNLWDV